MRRRFTAPAVIALAALAVGPNALAQDVGTPPEQLPAPQMTGVSGQSIRSIVRRGLKARLTCAQACAVTATVSVSSSLVEKVGLSSSQIGGGSYTLPEAGEAFFRIPLKSSARKRITAASPRNIRFRVTIEPVP